MRNSADIRHDKEVKEAEQKAIQNVLSEDPNMDETDIKISI